MGHVTTVQQMYAAFERGDVPAILEHVAEDVTWGYGLSSTEVPWMKPRHGRSDAANFFKDLELLEFHKFQPKTFLEHDNIVVALVDLEVTVKKTGQRFVSEDEAHICYFNAQGQLSKYGIRGDTYQQWVAYQGTK